MSFWTISKLSKNFYFQGCHIRVNLDNFKLNGDPDQKSNIILFIFMIKNQHNASDAKMKVSVTKIEVVHTKMKVSDTKILLFGTCLYRKNKSKALRKRLVESTMFCGPKTMLKRGHSVPVFPGLGSLVV